MGRRCVVEIEPALNALHAVRHPVERSLYTPVSLGKLREITPDTGLAEIEGSDAMHDLAKVAACLALLLLKVLHQLEQKRKIRGFGLVHTCRFPDRMPGRLLFMDRQCTRKGPMVKPI